jgi:anti-sigma regulatory factor (Ser/Thr protein kinase)
MSGRADVVRGSQQVVRDPEHGSGVGPASTNGLRVVATSWPLYSSLTLGALTTAPSCARLHSGAVLREWNLGSTAETVELIVSELVTNAVCAASGSGRLPRYDGAASGLPVIHLRLSSDQVRVMIEVWDQSPGVPEATCPEPDAESGRGLTLMEALSQGWGWERVSDWSGKVVWAEVTAARDLRILSAYSSSG